MWWLAQQATRGGGVDVAAVAALVTAVTGIALGAASLWRGRNSDQHNEITALWAENRALRSELDQVRDDVDSLRGAVVRCEQDKAAMARQLEALGGRP